MAIYSGKIVGYNLNTGDFKETVYDFGYKKGGLLNSLEKFFTISMAEELLFLFIMWKCQPKVSQAMMLQIYT